MPYNIDNSISNEPYYVVHKAESDKAKPRPIVKHRNKKSIGINSSLLHPYIPLGDLNTLMELKLSRKAARKKRRGRGYHHASNVGGNAKSDETKQSIKSSTSTDKLVNDSDNMDLSEDFVLFEPVKGKDLERLSQDFVRARGGSKQIVKSKLGYASLRQAIAESEARKKSSKMGRDLGFEPHPPLQRAIHGSTIALREAKLNGMNRAKKNAANDNDPSAIGWAYKHLKEAKTRTKLPKFLSKKFLTEENKELQRLDEIMEEEMNKLKVLFGHKASSSPAQNSSGKKHQAKFAANVVGGSNSNYNNKKGSKGNKKKTPKNFMQHLKHEIHDHKKDIHSMFAHPEDLNHNIHLPKIPEPEKAFSDIDESEEIDIDKYIADVTKINHNPNAVDNHQENISDADLIRKRQADDKEKELFSLLFASDPGHPLYEKLMSALDASNWAAEAKANIMTTNDESAKQIGQGKLSKNNPNNFDLFPKGHVPSYVGYVSKNLPNTEQTLHAAVDSCNMDDFWVQSALLSGQTSSGRSFNINNEIPDPVVLSDRDLYIQKLKERNKVKDIQENGENDDNMFDSKKKPQDPIFDGVIRPGKSLNPAYNLLKTNRDMVIKQNELYENLNTTIEEMNFSRADALQRRFFTFKGDDRDNNRKHMFHTDIEMMRLGEKVLQLEQEAHNINHGKWYQYLTAKTKGIHGSHLTIQEKKLLFALRSVVEDGNELTEDLFLNVLENVITLEDHAVFPLQNLIEYVRTDILDMELNTYWQWMKKNKIPTTKRLDEKLKEEGLLS